ncbi:hypothetical protein C0J09_00630 [Bordetella avium]|nr:hypothetical protein C0J09_00630 [Bordetella avium]
MSQIMKPFSLARLKRLSCALSIGAYVLSGAGLGLAAMPVQAADVINIAAPNQHGLSINKVGSFNVGAAGTVLNNSTVAGQSQLAGHLQANPNLAGGQAAKNILIQSQGIGQSRLNGALESFGGNAGVIIANPNGISVNGLRPININSLTLTTGDYQAGQAGDAVFDVKRGTISVGRRGVDTSGLGYFDLVADTISLNGVIGAPNKGKSTNITLLGGQNRYHVQDDLAGKGRKRSYTALNGNKRERVVVMGTAAGSMYGSNISLLASGRGVGVKMQGLISSANDIQIDASGDVSLNKVAADGSAIVNGGKLVSIKHGVAEGDFLVTGKGDIQLDSLRTDNRLVATAGGDLDAGDVKGSQLVLTAKNLRGDTLESEGDVTISARHDAELSHVQADGMVTASVGDNVTIADALRATGDVTINAGHTVRNQGVLLGDNLSISAKDIHNADGAQITADRNISLVAGRNVSNGRGAKIAAGNDLDIVAGKEIRNVGGWLTAGGQRNLVAPIVIDQPPGSQAAVKRGKSGSDQSNRGGSTSNNGAGTGNVGSFNHYASGYSDSYGNYGYGSAGWGQPSYSSYYGGWY